MCVKFQKNFHYKILIFFIKYPLLVLSYSFLFSFSTWWWLQSCILMQSFHMDTLSSRYVALALFHDNVGDDTWSLLVVLRGGCIRNSSLQCCCSFACFSLTKDIYAHVAGRFSIFISHSIIIFCEIKKMIYRSWCHAPPTPMRMCTLYEGREHLRPVVHFHF